MVAEHVPSNPPVLQTEWGYTSVDFGGDGTAADARARQAVFAVRSLLTTWAVGTPISIWYDVRDDCTDGADRECNFGLLANDYAEKPAMRAIKALASVAKDRQLTALLSTAETPRVLRLEGAADVVIVMWASAQGESVEVDAPTPLEARDMYGTEMSPQPQGDRVTLTVDETQGPIYLRYAKPVTADDGGVPVADGGIETADGGPPAIDAATGAGGDAMGGGCGCDVDRTPLSAPLVLLVVLLLALRRKPHGAAR